jgi:eukaryotic-like serine/threonine-protein kinase
MAASEVYRVGDLTLDVSARLLVRDGQAVTLPPKTFELLVELVRRAPAVVSRQELMDSVWVDELVNDETLTQRVMLLRRTIGDHAKEATYLASVPRWGYRIVAPVARQADRAATDQVEGPATPRPRVSRRLPIRRIVALAASVVVVVATVVLVLERRGWTWRGSGTSLAVVPFTVDPSAEPAPHVRCGLPEGITSSLSELPGVRVMAWSTMTHYQDSAVQPREIADELGVSTLLVGRVTEDRGMLAVMVELVDARDGTQLWGKSYLRPRESLLALQQQIASDAARALRPGITPAELQRLAPSRTDSFEAYESYLKGRYCWNRREPEMIGLAIGHFQAAIAADPGYAPAHAGLADCYVLLGAAPYGVMRPAEARRLAAAAAEQAIRADPSLAEAYATLALLAWSCDLDWQRAADLFARSLELNPSYATAHQWHAEYLAARGELNAAEREIRVALALDPLSPVIGVESGQIAYYRRNYPEAIARCERVLEVDPAFSQALLALSLARTQAGQHQEAISTLAELVEASGRALPALAAFGYACGHAGQLDRARAIRDELLAAGRERYVPPYYIAGVSLGLGDLDDAFECLFRAIEEPSSLEASLDVEPALDPLRDDPRYDELVRRLGLAR